MLANGFRNLRNVSFAEHSTGGIMRRIQHNQLGAIVDQSRKFIHIEIDRRITLAIRNEGRWATITALMPVVPIPTSDSAAGTTQQGRVRNPEHAAANVLRTIW